MPTAATELPWDQLLRHGSFVRALARSLVRDAATADDVAQSAWLTVARRAPAGVASLRGWLREVVGNVVRQRHRSETRLAARERAAARYEASLPAADVEAAQLEVQQRLLAAVQRLDAKYRSVVVLRFYEGLPPRKIAARLGLPIATVRTHLQRAIEQLRSELDAHSERGRAQWLEALAPLVVVTSAPIGAVVLASAAAVVLAASGAWWAVSGGGDASATEPAEALAASQEAPAPDEGAGGSAAATSATRSADMNEVASERPDVSGRVVDAFGRPIEGAAIELDDRDETTEPRRATSAADGRFAFGGVEFGSVELSIHHDGSVGWQRRLSLDRRSQRELGLDVVLLEGRTVRGVVVDEAGAPVAGARLVTHYDWLRGDQESSEGASDSDGRFALDGVPTCAIWLTVLAPGFARRCTGPFEAAAGDCTIALVAEKTPMLELVALDAVGAPLSDAVVSIQPEMRDGAVLRYFRLPCAFLRLELPDDGLLVMDELPAERYRVQVYSPSRGLRGGDVTATLAPGATTRLELRANVPTRARSVGRRSEMIAALTATVRGSVVDDGGAPVAGATIELERPGAAANDAAITTTTSDFDGSFEFCGLAPSSTPLRLRVGYGRPRATKVMDGEITLDAGSTIEGQRLVVPRCACVSGRVVDPEGLPLHGAIVQVQSPSTPIQTTTASDGTFRLEGLAPGEMRLTLHRLAAPGGVRLGPPPERRDSIVLTLAAGEARAGIELIDGFAPDERTLHGTIEAEGSFAESEGSQTYIAISCSTMSNGTFLADEPRFRIDGITDTSATLAASWSRLPDDGSDAPIRMVFGPRVQATPGRAEVTVPLPAPAPDSRVHARLVAAGGGAPTSPHDLVVAYFDGADTKVSEHYVHFSRADGEIVIEGLRPGRYELRIGEEIARRFEVVGSAPVELGDLELAAPARIEGSVADALGAPIVGARVGWPFLKAVIGSEGDRDWLDETRPMATTDAEGRFSLVAQEFAELYVVADGFAPMQLMRQPSRDGDPIVLLPCGDLVLTGFPRDLAGSNAWRTALLALDPPETRVGYSPEVGRMGRVGRSISFHRLPVGLYALCFWKVEPGVMRSNEPKPTQTVAHEAYRWTVEVKEGLTTTIDLSKEW